MVASHFTPLGTSPTGMLPQVHHDNELYSRHAMASSFGNGFQIRLPEIIAILLVQVEKCAKRSFEA